MHVALTGRVVSRAFNDALVEAGASLPVWLILNALRGGDHRSQLELARAIGIQGPTLARHLDNLDESGLIRRVRDAADRRNVQVELTPAGDETYERLLQAVTAFDRRLRAGFDDAELAQLGDHLERLRANAEGRA
jgi:MarR family transcriptional regulator, transcriptional regulator for hemolysin